MAEFAWIAGVALLLAATVRAQRRGPFLQYLYFCRFPLLTAAALVGFPLLATTTVAASLLENLFWLDLRGIFLVAWLALLAAWVVMVCVEVVLLNASLRFLVAAVTPPALRPAAGTRVLSGGSYPVDTVSADKRAR